MLRFFHRYSSSVFGFIMIALISLSMLFFGMDFGMRSDDRYAIKVGETEISFSEFYSRREQAQEQMRQALGENYARFAPTLLANLNEQLIDATIHETLMNNFAHGIDMFPGKEQVEQVKAQVLPPGLDQASLNQMLQQLRLSPETFEQLVSSDALQQQMRDLIVDASQASQAEIIEQISAQETKYSAQIARLTPEQFTGAVAAPMEEEVFSFYEENAVQFELPEQVQYRFAIIDPTDNLDLVEIYEEDLELYYTDNLQRFRTPEEVLARSLQLKFEAGNEVSRAGVRSLAEDLHKRIAEGEDISVLAEQYSDDATSAKQGGQIGWVKRGSRSNAFDEAVFSVKDGGLADIIATSGGFEIVFVDDYRESDTQPFEDVKEQIEREIRLREAPAFVAVVAEEMFESWSSGQQTLEKIAEENQLTIAESGGLLERTKDPEGARGLTRLVLEDPAQQKQLIDLGERFALVEVTDFQETRIPPLEEVEAEIVSEIQKQRATEKAKEIADELLAKTSEDFSQENFKKIARELGAELDSFSEFSQATPPHPVFRNERVLNSLRAAHSASLLGGGAVEQNGEYIVVAVTEITPPESERVNELLQARRGQVSNQLAELTLSSMIQSLKDIYPVDVDASLYNS